MNVVRGSMKIKNSLLIIFLGSFGMSDVIARVQTTKNDTTAVIDAKPHPKYRNIIFDLGRVLIEWDPVQLIKEVFTHEKNVPTTFVEDVLDATKTQLWLEYDKDIRTTDYIIEQLCIQNPQLHKQHFTTFMREHKKYMNIIPAGLHIFNLIKQQGYRIYILSNMPMAVFNTLAAKYDFFKQVDGMIISGDVKQVKPEPEIYQTLLTKYQLKPEECLFLDDKVENIEAGKALGIDGIVCLDHAVVLQQLQDVHVIKAIDTQKVSETKTTPTVTAQ